MGGCAGGELAESGQESRSRVRIVEGVESDGRRKLWGFRAETDLKNVLLANGHQGVEFGSGIFFPMGASGENDRTGFVDVPLPLFALPLDDSAAVSAPTMAHDIKTECRLPAKIGFESQRRLLLIHAAEDPVNWQSSRAKLEGDAGVLKTPGRELEAGVKAEAIHPAEFGDTPFSGAGRLNPAQGLSPAAAVVSHKEEIPSPKSDNYADNVDDKRASHG